MDTKQTGIKLLCYPSMGVLNMGNIQGVPSSRKEKSLEPIATTKNEENRGNASTHQMKHLVGQNKS